MSEVVVGVDGSAASLAAMHWAIDELVRRGGGRLHVVHTWEYPVVALAPSPVGTVVPPSDEMQRAAEDALATILEQAGVTDNLPKGVELVKVVRAGGAASVLLGLAKELPADLVVVGARGRGGFVGLLLGSVATQVVNHATVPTVVVPAPTDDEHTDEGS
ncbi:MAG TPA: universal stress protein [Acidimicrobiales bacterium]